MPVAGKEFCFCRIMKNSPYEPEAVDMVTVDGKPRTVRIRKRVFRIVRILNMWRLDEDWWRTPVSRLYLLLELDNGARVTVFRDLLDGAWYRQSYGE